MMYKNHILSAFLLCGPVCLLKTENPGTDMRLPVVPGQDLCQRKTRQEVLQAGDSSSGNLPDNPIRRCGQAGLAAQAGSAP